jgi:hypothetical protein
MNLVSLPDGRIVNLDYLTHLEQTSDYVSLHLAGGDEGDSIIRVKQGEGARRVLAHVSGKCEVRCDCTTLITDKRSVGPKGRRRWVLTRQPV